MSEEVGGKLMIGDTENQLQKVRDSLDNMNLTMEKVVDGKLVFAVLVDKDYCLNLIDVVKKERAK